MIARLVEALRGLDPPPSVEELADALWLARHLPRDDRRASPAAAPDAAAYQDGPGGPGGAANGSGASREAPATASGQDPPQVPAGANGDGTPGTRPAETSSAVPQAGLFLTGRDGGAAAASYPVRSPAVPAVPRTLAISRALRPLRLHVRSPLPGRLDEPETARRFAETGAWEPVLRPATERRFELILVVDVSPSMALWRRTADELRLLLERLGVFRDVRVRYLDTGAGPLVLRAAPGPSAGAARTGNEPGGPGHRRIMLVLSDCIGAAWQDGRAAALLGRWGRAGAVAIVQPLPQRLWWRCGAAVEPVRLAAPAPGAANARLAVRTRERGVHVPPGVAVPVMELEPRWLRPWAGMVAGAGHEIAGAALFTGRPVAEGAAAAGAAAAGARVPSLAPEEDLSSPARVLRFRASASPAAFELAGYLAAAPLRLPVMRLVQRSMLPRSTPAHLAEVFLSGLLRVAGDGGGDPDEVAYDFQDGVRDVLLGALRRDEALGVLRAVWDTVRARMGSSLDFPALLAAVRTDTAPPPLDRPFAQVAAQVLARLGGRYTEIAERIAGTAVPQGQEPGAAPESEPAGRRSGVPPRDPAFTGRRALLSRIETELRGGLTALLPEGGSTLGCVGKTQIAVEYAHAHARDYAWTWWIPASDPVMARAALRRVAADLGLPPGDDPPALAGRVLEALRAGLPDGRWLLVYDGACAPGDLLRLMPPAGALGSGGAGDVLVTSRHRAWARTGTGIAVGAFERAESVALLGAQIAALPDADQDRLAFLLNDLPPALRMAIGLFRTPGLDVERYRRDLDSIGHAPYNPPHGPTTGLAPTTSLALDRLREADPAAAELLELWPFLSSGPVPAWLLAAGRSIVDRVLGEMRAIDRMGLGRFDPVAGTLQVSAEVRDMVTVRMSTGALDRRRNEVHALLAAAMPESGPADPASWDARVSIGSQVVPAELVEAERTEAREVVVDQVVFLRAIGEHDAARRLGEGALAEWRDRFGARDALVAELERAVERRRGGRSADGAAPPDPGGAELRLRGDFEGAYRVDSGEWRRMRQRYGDGDTSTLRAAAAVGTDLYLLGRFHEAHAVDMDTLDEILRGDRPAPEQVLPAGRRVARDLHGLGRYEEALRLLGAASDEAAATFGAGHPEVLRVRGLRAGTLRKAGETPEAVRLADEAFDGHAAWLGESHPAALGAAMTAALAHTAAGDPRKGRGLAEQALAGYRATLGPRHPFTHACAAGLGVVLRALGDVREALEIDQTAHAALRDHPGPEHYYTLCCANGLANDLWLLGEPDAAYELAARTAEEFWTRLGPEHPYTLACAHNSERIRGSGGEEALAGLAAALGDGHPEVQAAAAGEPLECDIELPSL
ncbi:FxSxx-COOH system tetratricopeptide repeat protein [Spirillospora sp. NPDC029432]|uniref:FxSxx-COOH system tetratricopeptide repeat protein n=1 Tax=Spirillospora sp. NPDC029432 TaxID=3154599 RepID=UPI0034532B81